MKNNLFYLDKRFYIVTGAAGLLGRQHCEAILSAQGIPIAVDLNQDRLIEMRDELKEIAKGSKMTVLEGPLLIQG